MSNTPDFVFQVEEAENKLNAKWQEVQGSWRDLVADSYRKGEMEPYMSNFQRYLSGEGNGYGLTSLLQQMEIHLREMASLTGYEENVAYY